MENQENAKKKDLKVEVSCENENPAPSGLTRQPSSTKNTCLCSPTTHAGSFRCRLHRAPSLQRTRSMDTSSISTQDSPTKSS
ncbi:hypothetical protein EUGRSUZ_H02494 [Eucalyptus grandis]|uniref:Uncharacterized protein n=3 Tax=Eucalyptus TaxID=3932 RepID=A0ACC3JRU9_EUCGR|nr:hypothetical protein EUGRSUZ_H02494 [Eucalyptus grandis]